MSRRIGDQIHDTKKLLDDLEGNTGVIFDLAGQELGVYDYETEGAVARIFLTPPDYIATILTGNGPQDFVRCAARLLEYAGSDDSGDADTESGDDTDWKSSVRYLANRLRELEGVGDDSHLLDGTEDDE